MRKNILTVTFILFVTVFHCKAQSNSQGKNIISVLPMQIIGNGANNVDEYNNDGSDIAIGFAYERIMNNDYISAKIPFSFSIENPGYYYIMPTFKLFPTGQGSVRYAIGPQFYIGFGKVKNSYTIYDNNSFTSKDSVVTFNKSQLGFMVNNSLNVTIIKNVFIGIDLGLGILYYDSEISDAKDQYDTIEPFDPTVQFNFCMGYKF